MYLARLLSPTASMLSTSSEFEGALLFFAVEFGDIVPLAMNDCAGTNPNSARTLSSIEFFDALAKFCS